MEPLRNTKRPRAGIVSWRDLPDFCDASASVASATFGARRLPEIKSLWNSSSNSNGGGGEKPSSAVSCLQRHLRRRATSHASRKRHRFPSGNINSYKNEPRKQKQKLPNDDDDGGPQTSSTLPTRRMRRKNSSLLRSNHDNWRESADDGEQVVIKADSAGEGEGKSPTVPIGSSSPNRHHCYWMTTHLWHAKRFRMETLWNWKVPIVHSSRGAKAALRLANNNNQQLGHMNKCLLQDATWCMRPIVLRSVSQDAQDPTMPSLLMKMQALLSRIIPNFSHDTTSTLNHKSDKTTTTTTTIAGGEGVMYHKDQFPLGAIGPVQWLFSHGPLFVQEQNEDQVGSTSTTTTTTTNNFASRSPYHYLYLWVQPSIRQVVSECITELLKGDNKQGPLSSLLVHSNMDGGLAYFRLRGQHVVRCLFAALPLLSHALEDNLGLMLTDDNLFEQLPHHTAISVSISSSSSNNKEELLGGRRLVLLSQRPRNPDLACNRAVCGLDLLLCSDNNNNNIPTSTSMSGNSMAATRALFVALVVQGGACAIGMAEQAHAYLEASPPLLVFPRDYPDTPQGKLYWKGAGEGGGRPGEGCKQTQQDEVATLRHVFESGTGRIPRDMKSPPLLQIDWTLFVGQDEAGALQQTVVVVRGQFGKPFMDALLLGASSSVRMEPLESSNGLSRWRRKRRPTRPTRDVVRAPPLSKESAMKHQTTCQSLLQSLSLPALLVCHVTISGKGTARPGSLIFALGRRRSADVLPIGCISAGAFSSSRGASHGLSLCGAGRLLEAIAVSQQEGSLVISKEYNSAKEVCIRVEVGSGAASQQGIIRLML